MNYFTSYYCPGAKKISTANLLIHALSADNMFTNLEAMLLTK